jgi:hypothetical protein
MTKHVGPSRFLWCRDKLFTPFPLKRPPSLTLLL